jgi:hypothetical protein
MYTINADFMRFDQMHVGDLFGAAGVYVLWDARAKARPTYIGEGNILQPLANHSKRDGRQFPRPLDGYIAVIDGSTDGVHKLESCVVERLLLDVARDTDRAPTVNVRPGAGTVVRLLCQTGSTLRVAVRGYDPLIPPREVRPLERTRAIKAWLTDGTEYDFDHDWRLRRRRMPIARLAAA